MRKNLVQIIKERFNMTDQEIADALGLSSQTIRMWKWGVSAPSRRGNDEKLLRLARRLDNAGREKWYPGQAFDYLKDIK